jgi:hypothetical protein
MSEAVVASPQFTLHYFNIRGKAEPIRLLMEDQGFPYSDVRIERDDWWSTQKKVYHEQGVSPFGQLPVASYGSMKLAQRFVLHFFDWDGCSFG